MLLLAVVAILLCIGGLSYLNIRSQAVRQLVKGYQDKATEDIGNIEALIMKIERELHYLSRNPVVQKTLQNRYKTYLEANNEIANHVETHFWYLTTSISSGVKEMEIISFREMPQVGNFIYGKNRLEKFAWYDTLKEEKHRLIYAEGKKVYLVYPIYRIQAYGIQEIEMIGAIWVRLDIEYLWQKKKDGEAILGWQLKQAEEILQEKGSLTSGLLVQAESEGTGFRIAYAVARPALLEGGLVMLILVVFGGVAIIVLFLHYTAKMNEDYEKILEEKRKQEYLQAMVLKAQISPHFLYNIMSMINWKAKYSGQEDISRICVDLSNFYRTALNRGKEEITIKDELLNIESYLKLKQHLVEIPFTYQIDIEPDCESLKIINFILQPIVENAILHGIGKREEGGRIRISVKREEEAVLLAVWDNGPELVSKEDFFGNKSGYGIHNVNKRIQLKYGEDYGIFLKNDENGTEVTLRVGVLTKNIVII